MMGFGAYATPSAYNPAGSTADNSLYVRSMTYVTSKSGGKVVALVAIGILALWFLAKKYE